jgi:ParB-like chromosome segregation protein Spo0J
MVKLLEEDRENIVVKLSDLHKLEDVGIPDADLARRGIDREHVQSLAQSDQTSWPPILITSTDAGYVVIDGYHRWEAITQKKLDEIRATCKTFKSEKDVIEACFQANLKHGLPLSQANRSNYAYWLHKSYPKLTQKEIAERAQIKQSTVSKAIARRETPKMTPLPENEQREHIRKTCERLTHDAVRLFQDIEKMPEAEQRAAIAQTLQSVEERETLLKVVHLLEDVLQPARRRARR